MKQEYIVAEVSKNWPEVEGSLCAGKTVAMLFEVIIETNRQRGYVLHQFSLHRMMDQPGHMNETIIAVFRRT
jgi:hypothetical protein